MCNARPPQRVLQQSRTQPDNSALQQAIEASRRQNDLLVAQLNQQRSDAEAQTRLRSQELAAEQAALQSARAAQQQGAYASLTQASPTEGAMVTTAATPKKKPKESLRIASPSRTGAGAGLNLGV